MILSRTAISNQAILRGILSILLGGIMLPWGLQAQTQATVGSQSTMTISGTSTLHDWEMDVEKMSGAITYSLSEDGNLAAIEALTISMKSEALKSGKRPMDNNTYTALKTDKYSTITYKMSEVLSVSMKGDGFLVKTRGKLTIAGVTKTILLSADCKLTANGMKAKGSYTLDMTDYQVEPPSFMFGTVTTGEEVTLNYDAFFVNR